jgi:hypothetical protein
MGRVTDPAVNLDEEPEEPKPPALDATLDEAGRILVDYIALLSEKRMLTASH